MACACQPIATPPIQGKGGVCVPQPCAGNQSWSPTLCACIVAKK
jgi:hypothetical protein